MLIRRINNKGGTVWTFAIGSKHKIGGKTSHSVGYSIAEVCDVNSNNMYVIDTIVR